MSACAWCLRYTAGRAERCIFNGQQCQLERRLEDIAHAINHQYRQAPT